MKALGTKISELRKARGMTQDELADKMGVSPQAVSKWENDLSMPDLPAGSGKNGQRYGAGHPADDRQSNDAENRSGNDYAADREWCDRKACRSRFCKRRSCRSDCRIA